MPRRVVPPHRWGTPSHDVASDRRSDSTARASDGVRPVSADVVARAEAYGLDGSPPVAAPLDPHPVVRIANPIARSSAKTNGADGMRPVTVGRVTGREGGGTETDMQTGRRWQESANGTGGRHRAGQGHRRCRIEREESNFSTGNGGWLRMWRGWRFRIKWLHPTRTGGADTRTGIIRRLRRVEMALQHGSSPVHPQRHIFPRPDCPYAVS